MSGLLWTLETPLLHFKDGNCTGCEYQAPGEPEEDETIKLEFHQRSYLSVTIGDNTTQFYVPIIYGSPGHKYFEEQTDFIFPEYGGDFFVVIKPDPAEPWDWRTEIIRVGTGRSTTDGDGQVRLSYSFSPKDPSWDVGYGGIVCELSDESNQPGCMFTIHAYPGNGTPEYVMPIANMSDSRFFGETVDGATLEGYRMDYD